MKKKNWIAIFIAVMIVGLTSCGTDSLEPNQDMLETQESKNDSDNSEETVAEETKVHPEYIELDTPYVYLYCPGEYEDYIVADITEDEYFLINISSKSSVGDVFLFGLTFGYEEKDDYIGTIESDGETIFVSAEKYELNLDDRWDQKEKDELKEIQDNCYEYMINRLRETEGFTARE